MTKDDFLAMLGVVAGLVILWLWYQLDKKTSKILQLEAEIQENKHITEDIKRRLKDLVANSTELDEDVAKELIQISALFEIKQETKAIAGLAKIIENLLRRLYDDDPKFKEKMTRSKKDTPSFADYLDYAKDDKVINPEDYHLISVLRLIRNEESHELNIIKERSRITASFIAGLAFIITLTNLIRSRLGFIRPATT
jgi:uncharacterized membrane-anchored protein YhcB (DUF1043 family)